MSNTLDKEKELIDLLVGKLQQIVDDEVRVININDYTEERVDHMVSIGIPSTTPFHSENPMLPDYEYTLQILIDSFIDGDKGGYVFEQTKNAILSYLQTYLQDQSRLSELFSPIPVVGCFLSDISNGTSENNNRTTISLRVIASY